MLSLPTGFVAGVMVTAKSQGWLAAGWCFFFAVLWLLLRALALTVRQTCLKRVDSQHHEQQLQPHVVDIHINGVQHPVSYWSEKGGRPYQEDRHQELKGGAPGCSLYAVFDGHGGSRAAQYCKECLLQHVVADPHFRQDPARALKNAFYKTDAEFSAMAKVAQMTDGTTAVVGLVLNGRVYVANGATCFASYPPLADTPLLNPPPLSPSSPPLLSPPPLSPSLSSSPSSSGRLPGNHRAPRGQRHEHV